MATQNYTDENRRHWHVTFEPSGPEGTGGTMVFRSGREERRAPCRDHEWLTIVEGTLSPFELEETLDARFRAAK
ncbi:MAG TPA: hypothetical protein VH080_10670 [Gemmatimonadaceae bacterium]|nr:hypothetical protein [Gemmatimonadaceae bacterium]